MELDSVSNAALQYLAEVQTRIVNDFCERSLSDPEKRGVLVESDAVAGTFHVSLDSSVPHGRIHYKAEWTIGGTGD